MILEVENLRVGYNSLEVLQGINIKVREAEIVTLIGPNGSGKSTLFKAVCGLLRPVKGVIRFLGRNVSRLMLRQSYAKV